MFLEAAAAIGKEALYFSINYLLTLDHLPCKTAQPFDGRGAE